MVAQIITAKRGHLILHGNADIPPPTFSSDIPTREYPQDIIQDSLLHFWHAPLGVHSAIRRDQPPQRTVLSQVSCFIQCEVVSSRISLDVFQPRDVRAPKTVPIP